MKALQWCVLFCCIGCLSPVPDGSAAPGTTATGGNAATGGGGAGGGIASYGGGGGGVVHSDGGGAGGGRETSTEVCVMSDPGGHCLYTWPDAGLIGSAAQGLCGEVPALVGCTCALDAMGTPQSRCGGACVPPPVDAGTTLTCRANNCGLIHCAGGTTCVGTSRCGRCDPNHQFLNELWAFPEAESFSRCESLPPSCARNPTCECLLRAGPWLDYALAEDAGMPWPIEVPIPGKTICSYRVTCTTLSSGGLQLVCHAS